MTLCPYVKTHDGSSLRRDTPSLNAITTVGVPLNCSSVSITDTGSL
jgi:hypothetical protein